MLAPVTPEQLVIVESTVAALGPQMDDVAAAFYARLFELDPATQAMFPDPVDQRVKFAATLALVATSIRRHEKLAAATEELGRHHGALGVRAAHYRTGGIALLGALADSLGPAWTTAVEAAWRLAYELTVELMLTAGRGAARPGP
jgi:nitric oxide dioxygenase